MAQLILRILMIRYVSIETLFPFYYSQFHILYLIGALAMYARMFIYLYYHIIFLKFSVVSVEIVKIRKFDFFFFIFLWE